MLVQRVSDLGPSGFASRLQRRGIGIGLGPLDARLSVKGAAWMLPVMFELYRHYPLTDTRGLFSFHASITERRSVWRPWNRLVRFKVDGRTPHEDMPVAQALPVLEWGINLVIALRAHNYLMLHAAVLEKNGKALLLPAAPGAGKSTLCAALSHRGWRLLSDEFGLVRPGSNEFEPLPRPIALKNESIDVIRSFAPSAFIGPTIANTRKGDVAHLAVPADSIAQQCEKAKAARIVFPRWRPETELTAQEVAPAEAFMMLAMNAFNYELVGEPAFHTVARLIAETTSAQLVYSRLDDAVAYLDGLMEDDR